MEFINNNLKYPEEAKQTNIQVRVLIRFCINYNGYVRQESVIKGAHPLLDNEALKIACILPKWEPGKQAGKPVNVWYSIPVNFKLK